MPSRRFATCVRAGATVRYQGVARTEDGRWLGNITDSEGRSYALGEFGTPEAAALAHDRAILAILGPASAPSALNFRAAFSDTELRFLRGCHAPPRGVSGVIAMLGRGDYDAELARFAERAYDAYTDPELALDVATFRLAHRDALLRRKTEASGSPEAEREAFVEAARNKAMDKAWVRSYHRRRRLVGATFEDENRWPPVVPTADDVDVGDAFAGNELVYLPHGSCYVDEMVVVTGR